MCNDNALTYSVCLCPIPMCNDNALTYSICLCPIPMCNDNALTYYVCLIVYALYQCVITMLYSLH